MITIMIVLWLVGAVCGYFIWKFVFTSEVDARWTRGTKILSIYLALTFGVFQIPILIIALITIAIMKYVDVDKEAYW